jgi:cell division protease FtsH
LLVISGAVALIANPFSQEKQIPLTQLVQDINQSKIKTIVVSGNNLEITYQDNTKAKSMKETETGLTNSLMNYGVDKTKLDQISIQIQNESGISSWIGPILSFGLPILLFFIFFWFIMRQAKAGATQAFDFSKAKARLFGAEGHSKERLLLRMLLG